MRRESSSSRWMASWCFGACPTESRSTRRLLTATLPRTRSGGQEAVRTAASLLARCCSNTLPPPRGQPCPLPAIVSAARTCRPPRGPIPAPACIPHSELHRTGHSLSAVAECRRLALPSAPRPLAGTPHTVPPHRRRTSAGTGYAINSPPCLHTRGSSAPVALAIVTGRD